MRRRSRVYRSLLTFSLRVRQGFVTGQKSGEVRERVALLHTSYI